MCTNRGKERPIDIHGQCEQRCQVPSTGSASGNCRKAGGIAGHSFQRKPGINVADLYVGCSWRLPQQRHGRLFPCERRRLRWDLLWGMQQSSSGGMAGQRDLSLRHGHRDCQLGEPQGWWRQPRWARVGQAACQERWRCFLRRRAPLAMTGTRTMEHLLRFVGFLVPVRPDVSARMSACFTCMGASIKQRRPTEDLMDTPRTEVYPGHLVRIIFLVSIRHGCFREPPAVVPYRHVCLTLFGCIASLLTRLVAAAYSLVK
mmetsp:Transcript_83438/g.244634  ORF Transcript_83438/g.244634 Transcript_83438/m.244634 type:complete len:259 (+) Transcript_83438:202-978(+)